MTTQCFKKAICFTDIHFGLKQNSREHNELCLTFIKWLIEKAKEEDAETCIFLGDWHHVRSNVNVSTMDYTLKCLQLLNDHFEKVFFIVGNHDLFYKDNRNISSVDFGKLYPNIEMISDPLTTGNVTFLPWLVGDEWKEVKKIKSKYIFGHLEIPNFKMNAMVEMPNTQEIQRTDFKNQDFVFSGHFHKRQRDGNIIYIGNPFPHNFADAWDDERGVMVLEWDGDPKFYNFTDGPKYRSMRLTQLLCDPQKFIVPKTHAKIVVDRNLDFEEINFIKEILSKNLGASEIIIKMEKTQDLQTEFDESTVLESVDQIVLNQIKSIESSTYDINKLIEIYNELDI